MTKRVQVGDRLEDLDVEVDFAATEVAKIEANRKAQESGTKNRLAIGALIGGGAAVIISGAVGVFDGSFNEIQSVWNAAGPIIGGVYGHFFGGREMNRDGRE